MSPGLRIRRPEDTKRSSRPRILEAVKEEGCRKKHECLCSRGPLCYSPQKGVWPRVRRYQSVPTPLLSPQALRLKTQRVQHDQSCCILVRQRPRPLGMCQGEGKPQQRCDSAGVRTPRMSCTRPLSQPQAIRFPTCARRSSATVSYVDAALMLAAGLARSCSIFGMGTGDRRAGKWRETNRGMSYHAAVHRRSFSNASPHCWALVSAAVDGWNPPQRGLSPWTRP